MTPAEALTAAVRTEDQVIYGYGVAGAHLHGRDLREARAAYDAHRLRRERLVALLRRAGGTVPPAAPAYAVPFPVSAPADARRLCALLEDGCCGAAWDLAAVAAPSDPGRILAVEWLREGATAAAGWRRDPAADPALPGQPA
jgi:hypothetical protein